MDGRRAYLDTSAFVKLVIREAESAALRRFLAGRPAPVSSALLWAESLRAVRLADADALGLARRELDDIDLVAIDAVLLDRAAALDPPGLRTPGAIHLATALALGEDLDVVLTYDARMVDAARLLGIAVAAPA